MVEPSSNYGKIILKNCKFNKNTATSEGGAITNSNSKLEVISSFFTDNTATVSGGAIANDASNLTVDNSSFSSNSATYGGAIENNNQNEGTCTINYDNFTTNNAQMGGAIFDVDGNFNINNTNFTKNNAIVEGGAIDNHDTSTNNYLAVITGCTFNGNSSPGNGSNGNGDGGAIYNSDAIMNINYCNFLNNTANFGAIDNDPNGVCTINNSNFTSNIATSGGGAIINNDSTLTVYKCTFTSNKASNGGAIANNDDLIVEYSTFNHNTANDGGAIWNDCQVTVTSCNLTNNTAKYGGAIYNIKVATVKYNLIVGNTATTGSAICNYIGAVNAKYNWWGSNSNPSNKVYGDVTVSPWLANPITVTSTNPVNGTVNVTISTVIQINFNEPIKAGNMSIQLKNSKGTIIPCKISINGNTLTITPTSALTNGTKYYLTLHTGCVTDLAGNPLTVTSISFTTI